MFNTSTTETDFTSANTSTLTVFNTITTFNTTATTQTRYRSAAQVFSFFSCSASLNFVVYRVLGSGNSSSQTIQVNDYLYTNSGATSPLASGNYGIGSSAISGASHSITVGSNGLVLSLIHI